MNDHLFTDSPSFIAFTFAGNMSKGRLTAILKEMEDNNLGVLGKRQDFNNEITFKKTIPENRLLSFLIDTWATINMLS